MHQGKSRAIISALLPRLRYPAVLLSLLALIVVPAHIERPADATQLSLRGLIFEGLFTLLMLAALVPIADRRRTLAIGVLLSLPVVVFNVLDIGVTGALPRLVSYFTFVLFIGFIMLRTLIHARSADTDTICAALCLYLLCALNWGILYAIIETASPGSFSLGAVGAEHTLLQNMTYFSFITIATLGYGDILPLADTARVWASLESVFGQLFIAIVLARLVALQISRRD
jgi:hypothetical protein